MRSVQYNKFHTIAYTTYNAVQKNAIQKKVLTYNAMQTMKWKIQYIKNNTKCNTKGPKYSTKHSTLQTIQYI